MVEVIIGNGTLLVLMVKAIVMGLVRMVVLVVESETKRESISQKEEGECERGQR